MSKNKAKNGIVVNAGNGNYIPNIVRGGAAIPIGKKNFYYMQGRKHEQGGIDVGRNAKTGLEVEGEEVMQVTPNEVRVYSSVPFLRGVSPAELVLNGVDANKIFAAQEKYKDNNRINDDGTKYKYGGINNKQYYANNNSVSFRNNNKNNKTKNQKLYNKNNNIAFKYLANNDNIKYNDNDNINITNKSKMGKLVSINGNVKNGLVHTPNQDVLAHNRLVGADISQKPLDAKKDNTNVVHTISETERRTRKFVCGGRSKAKVGKGFRINNDKYNIGDTITYKDKQYVVTDRNEVKSINKKLDNYVDGVTGAARRISTSHQLTRNITNGLTNNAPTYKKNGETHYFVEAPKVDYDSGTSLADLQNLLNLTPRKGSNQSSSSSTGGVNNRTSKSAKPTIQRVNRLAPATNAEMAGIRRGLEPLLQNTIVDKLNKTVDNDLNVMPVQDDVAKTRNMDNILLGVNLGSSVLDAVMGNIYANQMHGYTAPNIIAPTIENPGEIKLNEEDLKDIPAPILMAAAKLKTRYNANPQLSKIEDDTRRIMGEIGRNTSNSRVALARKQRAALQGQQAKNEVYGRKENIETELINKDKLNQQEVTARNLARYDQYNQALAAQRANRARLRLAADTANIQNKLAVSTANAQLKSQADRFNATNRINQLVHQAGIDAAKAEARSNIFSGMLGNIGSALNTWNRNKRQAKLDEETLRVLGLRTPNANKLVLSALGY